MATYINSHVVARKLPGVKVQPVVGNFNLVSVDNLLLENAVTVAKTVSPGGVVERGETVEEAGGKATKTAVSESSVVFLGNNVFNSETKIGKAGW